MQGLCYDKFFSLSDDTNPLGYYRVTMYRYDQPQYESGTTCYTVNVADLQNRMIEVNVSVSCTSFNIFLFLFCSQVHVASA